MVRTAAIAARFYDEPVVSKLFEKIPKDKGKGENKACEDRATKKSPTVRQEPQRDSHR